jgi:hypothetical protein
MLRKIKSILLAAAILSIGLTVPMSNVKAAKPAENPMYGSNLTCGSEKAFNSLDTMKEYGYSSVNLNWYTDLSADELDKYLTKCDELGLNAIVSLMDAANQTSSEAFEKCVEYWLRDDIVKVMHEHKFVAFEIAAGWNPDNFETWQKYYEAYLPLINAAYTYEYKVYICAPACLGTMTPESAVNYLSSTLNKIKSYTVIHGTIVIDLGWVAIHIIWLDKESSQLNFDFAFLKSSDIDNVLALTGYCKENSITIFPIDWYNDNSNISMTKDWVNYTDIGYKLSNILLPPFIIYHNL